MSELVVASFNVHAGVDGYGRPYDVVGPCGQLDADVLVLQEVWSPPDGPSTAHSVATALGYRVVACVALAGARLTPPRDGPRGWWGPRPTVLRRHSLHFGARGPRSGIALADLADGEVATAGVDGAEAPPAGAGAGRTGSGRRSRRERDDEERPGVRGRWCLAVLSRRPVRSIRTVDLGHLRRDRAHRVAVFCEVDTGAGSALVVATHMSHLSHGSPFQFRRLHRALPRPSTPTVLLGDLNMWGPPLAVLLPGWRRAVKGRTYMSWRPIAQIDHILVGAGMQVREASVLGIGGSDHRPVRARLVPSPSVGASPDGVPAAAGLGARGDETGRP